MSNYARNCPSCGIEIKYKNMNSLKVCARKNTTCRSCRPKAKPTRCWLGRKHTQETIEKMRKAATGRQGANKGIPKSEETKSKMRLSAIAWLERNKGQCHPKYNPQACKLFDDINNKMGWKGMHAENGGEYHIKQLGYWVDYYEPNLNLVIEYDEKYHNNSIYISKDINRQKKIENELKCKFFRIKETDSIESVYKQLKELL